MISTDKKFLIIDGYSKESRDQFQAAEMKIAGQLYQEMLHRVAPNAKAEVFFPSDLNLQPKAELSDYDGVLWTGCNKTVFHMDDPCVIRMRDLTNRFFELGTPSFGSCWAAQIAVAVAGGEVKAHPRGREIGIARKIHLTEAGKKHPMYQGKNPVFDAFISHDDEITKLPPNAQVLAGNSWSQVQAVIVPYKKGVFWAVQYHPEYDLHEVARLFIARKEKMLRWGFFENETQLNQMVEDYQALAKSPQTKHLLWKYAIDEDVLNTQYRELEFQNWLKAHF